MKKIALFCLFAFAAVLSHAQTQSNQYKHINTTWKGNESYLACNFTATPAVNAACINGYQITLTPPSGSGAPAVIPACTATVATNCVGPGNSYSWAPGGFLYSGTWTVSIVLQYLDSSGAQQQLAGVTTTAVVPPPFVPPSPVTGPTATVAP